MIWDADRGSPTMRPNKGSNVALVALISLVVAPRTAALAPRETTDDDAVGHARAREGEAAPRTFGHPLRRPARAGGRRP